MSYERFAPKIGGERNSGIDGAEINRRGNEIAKWLALNTPLEPGLCAEVGRMVITGVIRDRRAGIVQGLPEGEGPKG